MTPGVRTGVVRVVGSVVCNHEEGAAFCSHDDGL